jgi:tetratricopeptide (TPR) repeat protein
MDPTRWQEVKRLVSEALQFPESEREDLLASAPEELRQAVRDLLEVSETWAEAFEHFRIPSPTGEIPFRNGDRVGRYVIEEEVRRGGMGAVYRAQDERAGRFVALKILPPRLIPYAPNEDKALARLSHSRIATFYESDVTENGFRYIAMEYVEGVPITAYCAEQCPTVRRRLVLFRKVCEAVEYAHGHLVIHRDLKPDNILVTADGEPKLLDFGIAKILPSALELATLTSLPDRAVTIAFASPEQLGGEHTTTATDVYSLGVLLCLLLTGRLPYDVESPFDLASAIRKNEPKRPSALVLSKPGSGNRLPEDGAKRLRRRLEGDLDAIVLKALRKEPERRYRSVAELSEDLRRFLDHEPVDARRGTRRYRALKFVERHRIGVSVAALALLLLLGFTAALFVLRREALRERDAARRAATRAQTTTGFLVDMFKVSNPWTTLGTSLTAREVLDDAARKLQAYPPPDPAVRGTLLRSLGKINLNLGSYPPADVLLEPALSDLQRARGDNRSLIAETLADLATVSYHEARYAEAERYAHQALSLAGERDRRQALEVRTLFGRIAFARGDYAGAERHFREALKLSEALHGASSLRTGSAVHDLACALHADGRYVEAERLYRRSLVIREQILGKDHHSTLQVLQNLASLVRDRGALEQAEADFWAVRMGFRRISDPNYPGVPTLFHNMGVTYLSRGELHKAEEVLFNSLAGYRVLYPDEHPHVGRALAELGRFFALAGRRNDAERYYRSGLERLDLSLGKDHPDAILAANNLAALLAAGGHEAEAETLWRDLLRQAQAHPIRRDLEAALHENIAALHDGRPGAYRTLGLEMLDLSDTPDYVEAPPRPAYPAIAVAGEREKTLRFFDDFNDGLIDPGKWETSGQTVTEENGHLDVLTAATDRFGQARTVPIRIDPTRPITISRRVKLHAANEYSDGKMTVGIIGYPEKTFLVSYANYHYTGNGEGVTVGFSICRHDTNPHKFADRRFNASPLIPPVWDRWLDEVLRYDPRTGEVQYLINGAERIAYNVGPLPPNASSITLTFQAWGWYTGHRQEMDYLRVEQ